MNYKMYNIVVSKYRYSTIIFVGPCNELWGKATHSMHLYQFATGKVIQVHHSFNAVSLCPVVRGKVKQKVGHQKCSLLKKIVVQT